MLALIISSVLSIVVPVVAYYMYKRHKRMASGNYEPLAMPDYSQGAIDDKPYVMITDDSGHLALYFKTITSLDGLNREVFNQIAVKYTISLEEGRLAIRALQSGEAPIVEDARRLLTI